MSSLIQNHFAPVSKINKLTYIFHSELFCSLFRLIKGSALKHPFWKENARNVNV